MFWWVAQACVVIAVLFISGGLFLQPDTTLDLLWGVLVPALPVTFLISPILWRSLCPLATLNMVPNGWISRRAISTQFLTRVGTAGVVLLAVMVPARRFLFNENGIILAITILLIAGLAIALGTVFDAKAGFCNAICPILPVEKLYGQHPLWQAKNPRCSTCTLCTPKGCIDLAPKKSIATAIGPANRSHAWLKTPYGVFAAAFPGFIAGYFTTPDVPLAGALSTYLHIGMWAVVSYLVLINFVLLLNLSSAFILPPLAATSIGIYYWFAAPHMLSYFSIGAPGVVIFRSIIFALVGFWLGRALFRVNQQQIRRQPDITQQLKPQRIETPRQFNISRTPAST